MSSTTYTLANWNTGMTITPQKGDRPEPTPRELIVTRAVETRDGWRGQVIVDQEIVYETEPVLGGEASQTVLSEANGYVVDRVKALFR